MSLIFTPTSRDALRKSTLALSVALSLISAPLAHALTFNVTYDASVGSAPVGFTSAFWDAIGYFQSTFSNPVSINLNVGWGEVSGQPLGGALGASSSYFINYDYATVRNALLNVAAPGYLPVTDPTNGRLIDVNAANAKVLGLNTYSGPHSSDGAVGFDSSSQWTFDPNNRAVSGSYDFIGVAMHEISEVMGRSSSLVPTCTGSGCSESVQNLFRYTAPGQLDLTGTNAYLSINGGTSQVNAFNGDPTRGDLGDWNGNTPDAYNYAAATGQLLPASAADITAMRALGYTLATPVPVPDSALLLLSGLGLTVWLARRRKTQDLQPG
ncbi:MAG: NF038122 family metalloprotease [Pseudomonadota bacterium]